LPSRMINKEVFENELPFAALKRSATVRAFNLTVGRRKISVPPEPAYIGNHSLDI
jgi:hypothetical protein